MHDDGIHVSTAANLSFQQLHPLTWAAPFPTHRPSWTVYFSVLDPIKVMWLKEGILDLL